MNVVLSHRGPCASESAKPWSMDNGSYHSVWIPPGFRWYLKFCNQKTAPEMMLQLFVKKSGSKTTWVMALLLGLDHEISWASCACRLPLFIVKHILDCHISGALHFLESQAGHGSVNAYTQILTILSWWLKSDNLITDNNRYFNKLGM